MPFSKSEVNRAGALVARHFDVLGERQPGGTPANVETAIEVVDWWRSEHARPLSRVAANLRYYTAKEGPPVVAQRLKRVPTIAGKLQREPKMKLARMGDIGGVRAVLSDQDAAYRVAAQLRRNWTITRFSDYVRSPKHDGYRALHLINRHRGRLIEIQLRTRRQDEWANLMELFSRSVAPGLKFGEGPDELRELFRLFSEFDSTVESSGVHRLDMLRRLETLLDWVDTFLDEHRNEP